MNVLRKISSGLTALIVTIAVFLLGLSLAIASALGSAQPVKDALASSGVYEEFVGEAVDDIPGTIGAIIEFEPEMRQVIIDAAIPSMKEDTEAGIDTILAWMKDSSQEVTVTVDAAGAEESVAKAVGEYTQKLIEDMPECTSMPSGFNVNNPFIWECKLPRTNAATYNEAFYEIVKDNEFWSETTYTLDDILGVSEQELTEDYQVIAAVYPSAVATAWISGIVIVLGIVATWFLTRTLRSTLRRMGISLIVGGVLLIASFVAATIGLGIAADELGGGDALEAVSADIIAGLGGVASGWLLQSGAFALIIGLAGLLGSFFIKKSGDKMPTEPQAMTPTPSNLDTTQQTLTPPQPIQDPTPPPTGPTPPAMPQQTPPDAPSELPGNQQKPPMQ